MALYATVKVDTTLGGMQKRNTIKVQRKRFANKLRSDKNLDESWYMTMWTSYETRRRYITQVEMVERRSLQSPCWNVSYCSFLVSILSTFGIGMFLRKSKKQNILSRCFIRLLFCFTQTRCLEFICALFKRVVKDCCSKAIREILLCSRSLLRIHISMNFLVMRIADTNQLIA